jgi:hypothetical protein
MLAKFGAIVTEGRGKLGDVVFSRNHYGASAHAYAPPYSKSHGTPSEKQVQASGVFAYTRSQWALLSEEERLAWRTAATTFSRVNVFGDKMPLTGQALFVKLNHRLIWLGMDYNHLPPTPVPVQCIKSLDTFYAANDGTMEFYFTNQLNQNDFYFWEWSTPSLSPGINSARNFPRLIARSFLTSEGYENIGTNFFAYFNALPVAGKKIFLLIQTLHTRTGLISPPLMISTIVQNV